MIQRPALGIRFDITKVGTPSHAEACWKTLWDAVERHEVEGVLLFEGETRKDGDRVFCIAVHGTEDELDRVAESLGRDPIFRSVAAAPAFVWDAELDDEPLVPVGAVAAEPPRPDLQASPLTGVVGSASAEPQPATAPVVESAEMGPAPRFVPLVEADPAAAAPGAVDDRAAAPAEIPASPELSSGSGRGWPTRRVLAGSFLATAMIALVLAAVALPRAGQANAAEVILTSSDREEIADAVDEIARSADTDALRRLIAEAGSQPEVSLHVETIRDRMIDRLDTAASDEQIRILEALAVIDDEASVGVLVESLRFDDDPSVTDAAAELLPTLQNGLRLAIELLVQVRTHDVQDPQEGARIEEVLRAIGDPAVRAVEGLPGTPEWTIDFLISMGEPVLAELEGMVTSSKLGDLVAASETLAKIQKSHPDLASPLWDRLVASVRPLVNGAPRRAQQVAGILQQVARVRPGVAKPLQRRLVGALIGRLGGSTPNFTLTDTLARIGRPAVPKLIPIARQRPGAFVSQEAINRADQARLALVSMVSYKRKALRPLLNALRGRDYELIADLMLFYVQLGKPGTEGILLEAQNRHGDGTTAIWLLESGNGKLERGVHDWAARNGYTITGSIPGPGSWGTA